MKLKLIKMKRKTHPPHERLSFKKAERSLAIKRKKRRKRQGNSKSMMRIYRKRPERKRKKMSLIKKYVKK